MCINFHTSDQLVSQVGSSIGVHQLLARIHTSLGYIALYHIYIYLYIIINITSDYRTPRTSGPRFQDSSRSTPGGGVAFLPGRQLPVRHLLQRRRNRSLQFEQPRGVHAGATSDGHAGEIHEIHRMLGKKCRDQCRDHRWVKFIQIPNPMDHRFSLGCYDML